MLRSIFPPACIFPSDSRILYKKSMKSAMPPIDKHPIICYTLITH